MGIAYLINPNPKSMVKGIEEREKAVLGAMKKSRQRKDAEKVGVSPKTLSRQNIK